MSRLRFAILGAGFWAHYQLGAWRELDGAECVAVCDPVRDKAASLAAAQAIPHVYNDAAALLRNEQLDFIDIVTPVETHRSLVELAAAHGVAAICQKPMGVTLAEAEAMVRTCQAADTPLLIHENWRWQTPLRALKAELAAGRIGQPFRARLSFCSSFPVFDNQPQLKELAQFILTDMGSHILDVARFLFGEATTLYCQTQRIHRDIRGEDVATVIMKMQGVTVTCELSYASRLERERFPETFVLIEGARGSLELAPDYWLRVTDETGTQARRTPPPRYEWANPAYDLVQASIVPCCANLLQALRGAGAAETTAGDNLKTMQLVFAAYEAAQHNAVVALPDPSFTKPELSIDENS